MKGRVSRFHGNESSTASCADFPASSEGGLDRGPVIREFNDPSFETNWTHHWRWPFELNGVVGRYRARRFCESTLLHEVPSRRPVRMAIKNRADDSAVEHSWKCFVMGFRCPVANDFGGCSTVVDMAVDTKTLRVQWTASKTGAFGSILTLQAQRF